MFFGCRPFNRCAKVERGILKCFAAALADLKASDDIAVIASWILDSVSMASIFCDASGEGLVRRSKL